MKLLLIGSGGREHALAWALAKSPKLTKLYAAPGNAGIAEVAELCNLDTADHQAVIGFCREHAIDLVVVGPEAPLVAGLVDDLEAAGIKAFGPSRAAAQLEGSKAFTKGVCDEADIPTAGYGRFDTADAALAYAVLARPTPAGAQFMGTVCKVDVQAIVIRRPPECALALRLSPALIKAGG